MKRLVFAFLLLSTPAFAAGISPQEAAQQIGKEATVTGKAAVYTARSGVTFMNLGGSGPGSPFTGVIFKGDAAKFPAIASYNGRMVEISGKIELYQGKPEIIMKDSAQLRLVQ